MPTAAYGPGSDVGPLFRQSSAFYDPTAIRKRKSWRGELPAAVSHRRVLDGLPLTRAKPENGSGEDLSSEVEAPIGNYV